MKAAIYVDGVARQIIKGSSAQLNANTGPNKVWREIPPEVVTLSQVPPLESLDPHPDFVQREA